jgi:rod shape-determining protein MreD
MFLLAAAATLLLRSTLFAGLVSRGIVIDVLALATVAWSMRHRESWGSTFGFLLGLAADLDAAHWLGRHALALTLLGYGVGRLSNTLVKDSPLTQLVLFAAATALHQAWASAFDASGGLAGLPWLVGRVLLATLTTAPVGVLLLSLTGARTRRRRNAPGSASQG